MRFLSLQSRFPDPPVCFAAEVAEHRMQRVGIAFLIFAVVRLLEDSRARLPVFEIERGVDVIEKGVPAGDVLDVRHIIRARAGVCAPLFVPPSERLCMINLHRRRNGRLVPALALLVRPFYVPVFVVRHLLQIFLFEACSMMYWIFPKKKSV